MCARLSREIIAAHDIFMRSSSGIRAIGYFTTASMVEAVYHLAPVLNYSKEAGEHEACVTALKQAHRILLQLAPKLSVAKRALKALKGVIERFSSDNGSHSSSTKDTDAGMVDPGTVHVSQPLFQD